MARSADVRADESADMFNGLLRLRQNCREQLPHTADAMTAFCTCATAI
jgi:hypothetical protein